MIATNVKYKKTGIAWMPEVPTHWKLIRLKFISDVKFSTVDKHSHKEEMKVRLCNYVDVYKNEYITNDLEFMEASATDDEIKRFSVKKGDILLTKDSETFNDIAVPAFVVDDIENLVCGYHLAQVRVNEHIIDSNFLYRVLQSRVVNHHFTIAAKGVTRCGLSYDDISSVFIPFPESLEEQKAIARILEKESAKITRFIQTKQRFIELLKEQRQSIITNAVTKGIDDGVKIKETVLGEIPEHWEVRRLKFCLNERLKYGANASGDYYNPSWYRYIRITDFTADGTLDENNKLSLSPENGKDYELKDGDILLARSGATVGKSFQFRLVDRDERCSYAGYLIKASPNEEIILSDFLYNYTLSSNYENWKNSIFIKATIENISADKYANLLVTLPPVEEQKRILEHIKSETKTLDIAISKAEREIELIKEYREAMIAEAVTGRIKL
ncbi:MAG: restriction endonuclease subunit S [Bacteroidetes bacterium]|uniref:restriction endonuclease subunit S n=1 Tax=Phnomibacter sp. TaxID=2836217 RepID=UPI002FDD971A|nr:restriction endonuclease subunit S [Bacteroidota bacterium]